MKRILTVIVSLLILASAGCSGTASRQNSNESGKKHGQEVGEIELQTK